MKETYFSAISLVDKPFVSFDSIGNFTLEEFAASPYASDPLIVKRSEVPNYAFGVCTAKIVGGVLVNRTPAEMAVFEAEYNVIMGVRSEAARIGTINLEKFTYDSNEFPMDEVSRLFYLAMEKNAPVSHKVRTMANTEYALDSGDIGAFLDAFYARLLLISKHTL